MRYEVPQYIEIKSKIVGPLTLRQFLFLLGAGLIAFLTHFIFSATFWIFLNSFVILTALYFAFAKPKGQEPEKLLWAAFNHFLKNKHYFWAKKEEEKEIVLEIPKKEEKEEKMVEKEESSQIEERKERKYDIEEVSRILDQE